MGVTIADSRKLLGGSGLAFDWTSQRILIVDRDEQFRFFARGLFKHHRVREVQSVARITEIPRILTHHEIHVAFVELTHEKTGVAHMLQWLRNGKDSPAPRLPVILLAKFLDRAQLARVCAFGIHGVLQKPVSGEQMLKAVVGVMTNPRMFKSVGEPVAEVANSEKGQRTSFASQSLTPLRADSLQAVAPVQASRPATEPGPRAAQRSSGVEGETLAVSGSSEGGAIETVGEVSPGRLRPSGPIELAEVEAPAVPGLVEAAAPGKQTKAETGGGPDVGDILEAHARWVRSGGSDGRRANLEGRDLSSLALAGMVLTSAMLRRTDLSGSDFTGAEMHGVDLRDAEALGGTFVGANLAVARLRHAKLRGSVFTGASLKGADLGGADLCEAKLGDADLTGAILLGARLGGADLSGVSGLTQGQLEGVKGDARTRLPPGLFLPRPVEP